MDRSMRIISVNVSLPKDVRWRGKTISTGIFKEPVPHRVKVRTMNIDGDMQADPTVHGGPDKALYAYAAEHYDAWKRELKREDLNWGMFGENLTVHGGLFENEVFVGDRFNVGNAEVVAVQPRSPCYKLGIRFGTQRVLKQFAKSGRFGIYFRVLKEGDVGVDDTVTRISEGKGRVSIGDVGRLLLDRYPDHALLARAAALEMLPERIRNYCRALLDGS